MRVTEDLTAGSLRGRLAEIGDLFEEGVDEVLVNLTTLAHSSVAVVLMLAVSIIPDDGVN